MPPVLHRYLGRELLQYWLIFTLVLWLVLVAARFSLYLGQAASGHLAADTVVQLLVLKSVGFLVFLMPLSLFLALLYLLGRLNRDYESLVLAVSGAGPVQLYRAIAVPVLGVTLVVAALSTYLVPRTAQLGYVLRAMAEQRLDAEVLTAGRFHSLRNGRWLLFAQEPGSGPGELAKLFVHIEHPQQPQVLVAEKGIIRAAETGNDRYLVLQNGFRYDGVAGQPDYRILRYSEYALRLPAAPPPVAHWDAMPSRMLWTQAEPAAHAELHGRLARPLTVLVLALIALPLGRFRVGRSRYYPLWLGVLVFTLYFNLLGTGQLWLEQGRVPAWMGLWWVHILVAALFAGGANLAQWWSLRRVAA